ncbi:MAG: bifunctional DNA-formamidopyrimidine glycosylase/DNA-(apurinic or apyrimidinic site) lyase [Candidatus Latescibacterota bacterium]|nr:MAG: bifunctional DNA-formamidopyrimidine glycosylase/DNA-(apurinic or apyrimidinic site) lyase [Candidatus Latescibacterota bacterium]
MPELPEVETIVRSLRKPLLGRCVLRARLRHAALYRRGSLRVPWLVGRVFSSVERIGKNALFNFQPAGAMTVNLGMTGRLILHSRHRRVSLPKTFRSEAGDTDDKHLHVRFHLDGGLELRYHDPRRFGFIYITESHDIRKNLALGPDPFDTRDRDLERALERREAAIKSLLLDQRVISGLGNIYADETLFEARIDPRTPGRDVAGNAATVLGAARKVLRRAIAHGGSTLRDYRKPDGTTGGFQQHHAVYGREGEPCIECGSPIKKVVISGRSSHFCPVCQR